MRTAGAVLKERAAAVRAVEEALDDAAAGRGRLVTVEGAAGMGKTALLATARARAAEAGFTVLHAVGNELEADFGYGVARHLLAGAADADARRILDGDSHGDPYAVLLALGEVL